MLEVSEKDIIKSLKRDNPWWDVENVKYTDKYSHRRAYFEPFFSLALNWSVKRSVILMGPRRVGKTVILQLLIAKAIGEGFSPESIFFASIDTPLYSGMPLERLLELFEKQTGHDPSEPRIVIFDEVQYLKDWEVHLKVLTDQHPNTRFL